MLIVHGIGRQRPGQTLAQFATPVRESLERCGVHVTVVRAESERAEGSRRVPAHEIWEACGPRGERHTWLVSESRWADDFPRPTTRRFIGWVVSAGPWLALFHLGATHLPGVLRDLPTDRMPKPSVRLVARLGAASLLLYLAFAVRTVALAVVLALLPFIVVAAAVPGARRPVRLLLEIVGDVLACASDENSRALMQKRISSDLTWCESAVGAGNVVVVAHSQGGMLARTVLDARPTPVRQFISMGSGLGAIHALAHRERVTRGLLSWGAFILFGAALAVLVRVGISGWPEFLDSIIAPLRIMRELPGILSGDRPGTVITENLDKVQGEFDRQDRQFMQIFVAIVLGGFAAALLRRAGMTGMLADWTPSLRITPRPLRGWTEFSSRHDPVSCGTLLVGVADKVVPVSNSGVLPLEHVRYQNNGIVSVAVARAMTERGPDDTGLDMEAMHRLTAEARQREQRRSRVKRLTMVTIWLLAAAAAFWILG